MKQKRSPSTRKFRKKWTGRRRSIIPPTHRRNKDPSTNYATVGCFRRPVDVPVRRCAQHAKRVADQQGAGRHSGGHHHGQPAAGEYRQFWDVHISRQSGGGGGYGGSARRADAHAVHSQYTRSLDTRFSHCPPRQSASSEQHLYLHVPLGRGHPDNLSWPVYYRSGVTQTRRLQLRSI